MTLIADDSPGPIVLIDPPSTGEHARLTNCSSCGKKECKLVCDAGTPVASHPAPQPIPQPSPQPSPHLQLPITKRLKSGDPLKAISALVHEDNKEELLAIIKGLKAEFAKEKTRHTNEVKGLKLQIESLKKDLKSLRNSTVAALSTVPFATTPLKLTFGEVVKSPAPTAVREFENAPKPQLINEKQAKEKDTRKENNKDKEKNNRKSKEKDNESVESLPSPLPKSARRPAVLLSDDSFNRMLSGQRARNHGLKWVYLQGIARDSLSRIRAFLARIGVSGRWIKHVGFTDKGYLEVLIFQEHADKISQGLSKLDTRISLVSNPELYPRDVTILKKVVKRMERNIKALHPEAHSVRRELERIKQAALGKLSSLAGSTIKVQHGNEIESHAEMDY